MDEYLKETPLLNYSDASIEKMVIEKAWSTLPEYERIAAIYDFVQNGILFGFNEADAIPASIVLREGFGQCNTKTNLFMALLRRCGIPCRFHAFTIDKALQKGAINGLSYKLTPQNIIHSWTEIHFENKWINLEGFILDKAYLESIQHHFPNVKSSFCGYAVATECLQNPPIEWMGTDTYIQKEGINHDFGIFNCPDDFYSRHGQNLSGLKGFMLKHVFKPLVNNNVSRIRNRQW